MAIGKPVHGNMKVRRVVLHGPPCVGKSSIKRLILGEPPLDKHHEKSTDVLDPPIRLITANRLAEQNEKLYEVDEEEVIHMIARQLEPEMIRSQHSNTSEKENKPDSDQMPVVSQSNVADAGSTSQNTGGLGKNQNCDSMLSVISQIGKVLLEKHHFPIKPESIYSVKWTHVVDCGGQPRFTDLLPLVFPSQENLYLLVIRLDEKLNEKAQNQYIEAGGNHNKSSESLALTNYEMIERMCQLAKLSNSCVKVIGTHLDCIKDADETVQEKEDYLHELREKYDDVLICDDKKVILPLNAMEKDESKRAEYTDMLKELILDGQTFCIDEDVPLGWMILQLLMSQDSKEGVIAYSEVQKYANELNIDGPSLDKALNFFSDLALCFYYPSVNRDVILAKIDVLTCNVSQIVKSVFAVSRVRPQSSKEQKRFKETGIFSKSLLLKLSPNLESELFPVELFLSILQYLKIIYSIAEDSYFFPGILPLAPADVLAPDNPIKYHPHPLLIFWKEAPLPRGFFSAVIVSLLGQNGISLCRGGQNFRNVVYLNYKTPSAAGVMLLVNRIDWMELFVCSEGHDFQFVRETVASAHEKVLRDSLKLDSLNLTFVHGLYCPQHACSTHIKHPCYPILVAPDIQKFCCQREEKYNWIEEDSKRKSWFYGIACINTLLH